MEVMIRELNGKFCINCYRPWELGTLRYDLS